MTNQVPHTEKEALRGVKIFVPLVFGIPIVLALIAIGNILLAGPDEWDEVSKMNIVSIQIESNKSLIGDSESINLIKKGLAGAHSSYSPNRRCGPPIFLFLTSKEGRKFKLKIEMDAANQEALIATYFPDDAVKECRAKSLKASTALYHALQALDPALK